MHQILFVYPVVHYESTDQVMRNAEIIFQAGCEGLFVIHMEGRDSRTLQAAERLKIAYPDKKIGVNLLFAPSMYDALDKSRSAGADMTWTDTQLTHSSKATWDVAFHIGQLYPDHLKFVGVGFKYQPREFNCELAAKTAVEFGLIPTTSGPATGKCADIPHISGIRRTLTPGSSLALASGITPDNVTGYVRYLSHILVSTGIADSFYETSPVKLNALLTQLNA